MAKTWIKNGQRLSPKTEFKKGNKPKHCFKKGDIPWNDSNTIIICDFCNKSFKRKPFHIKRNKNQFCSHKCASLWSYQGGTKAASLELRDSYIRSALWQMGFLKKDVTTEMIKIKRLQLKMYRNLKQFKQWRDENESNNENVYGEQQPDEQNNEGRV